MIKTMRATRLKIILLCFLFILGSVSSSSLISRGGSTNVRSFAKIKRKGRSTQSLGGNNNIDNTDASASHSSLSSQKIQLTKEGGIKKENQSGVSLKFLIISSFLTTFALTGVALSPPPILIDEFGADKATSILSSISSLAAMLEIILSPIFGSLLDSLGRKPVMIALTTIMATINMIVASSFFSSSSVNITNAILVSIAKLTNAILFPLIFIASSAVIGDVMASTPNKMGSFMAISMSLTSIGMICGVSTAGRLLGSGNNPHAILYSFASITTILSAIVLAVGLPETLPKDKRIPFLNRRSIIEKIKQAPASASRLLVGRGRQIRWLAILLVLQSLPTSMGDIFQVYSKDVWGLDAKDFASFVAIFCGIGFISTLCSSVLIGSKVGMSLKTFTSIAVFSSLFYPLGACISFRAAILGLILGFFAVSQSLGVTAQLTTKATTCTNSEGKVATQGELAGERASLVALTKAIGPLLYGGLFVVGNRIHIPQLLFGFNVLLGLIAFSIAFGRKDLWS